MEQQSIPTMVVVDNPVTPLHEIRNDLQSFQSISLPFLIVILILVSILFLIEICRMVLQFKSDRTIHKELQQIRKFTEFTVKYIAKSQRPKPSKSGETTPKKTANNDNSNYKSPNNNTYMDLDFSGQTSKSANEMLNQSNFSDDDDEGGYMNNNDVYSTMPKSCLNLDKTGKIITTTTTTTAAATNFECQTIPKKVDFDYSQNQYHRSVVPFSPPPSNSIRFVHNRGDSTNHAGSFFKRNFFVRNSIQKCEFTREQLHDNTVDSKNKVVATGFHSIINEDLRSQQLQQQQREEIGSSSTLSDDFAHIGPTSMQNGHQRNSSVISEKCEIVIVSTASSSVSTPTSSCNNASLSPIQPNENFVSDSDYHSKNNSYVNYASTSSASCMQTDASPDGRKQMNGINFDHSDINGTDIHQHTAFDFNIDNEGEKLYRAIKIDIDPSDSSDNVEHARKREEGVSLFSPKPYRHLSPCLAKISTPKLKFDSISSDNLSDKNNNNNNNRNGVNQRINNKNQNKNRSNKSIVVEDDPNNDKYIDGFCSEIDRTFDRLMVNIDPCKDLIIKQSLLTIQPPKL